MPALSEHTGSDERDIPLSEKARERLAEARVARDEPILQEEVIRLGELRSHRRLSIPPPREKEIAQSAGEHGWSGASWNTAEEHRIEHRIEHRDERVPWRLPRHGCPRAGASRRRAAPPNEREGTGTEKGIGATHCQDWWNTPARAAARRRRCHTLKLIITSAVGMSYWPYSLRRGGGWGWGGGSGKVAGSARVEGRSSASALTPLVRRCAPTRQNKMYLVHVHVITRLK